ncbi:hypothetical protein J2W42_005128 [Rhizobium tibeticum]|nr:hypothetical protein [Rhizobium tibeticum]
MRHRRSIDLTSAANHAVNLERETLASLPEMFIFAGFCPSCVNSAPIDRSEFGRLLGKRMPVANIAQRLKCSYCGNRAGNKFLLGRLPRG